MAKRTLTLSFDGQSIRMLLAQERQIQRWESVEVPAEHMDRGLIADPQAVAQALIELMGSEAMPRRRVITALSGHRAVSRILSLPQMKPSHLENAVRRQAKQELPLPLDETYLTWQLLGPSNSHLQVYAFAVPRPVIDRQVEALRAARLRPRAMELQPLALVRAVNQPSAVIVNLEDQSLGVVIVRQGVPLILRSVPQASEDSDLPSRIDRLAQELARTIRFFNEGHRADPVQPQTPVYATGSLLDPVENREQLAAAIQAPVELPQPPMDAPADLPIPTYACNLGLALKRV